MLFDLIDKIRKKPKATKELIAFGSSLAISLVIAVLWVATYVPHVGASLQGASFGNMVKPFTDLSGNPSSDVTAPGADSQMASPSAAFNDSTTTASSTDITDIAASSTGADTSSSI